jgi:hypothetical protein
MSQLICEKYAPYIVFHPDETCFPIKIEQYLSVCNPLKYLDPLLDQKTVEQKIAVQPTSDEIYQAYKDNKPVENLSFKEPIDTSLNIIKGDPKQAYCYVKVVETDTYIRLIYYYLFSHTDAYPCCGCCCPITSYAHKADIKYIVVELSKVSKVINKVYYGAHGSQSGAWKSASEIEYYDSHPVAYSAKGDHSFYYNSGVHPRIYFVVYDKCANSIIDGTLCKPLVYQTVDDQNINFRSNLDGWNYLQSKMNVDGIDSPSKQGFWNNNIAEASNNWFKRLFCCNYF